MTYKIPVILFGVLISLSGLTGQLRPTDTGSSVTFTIRNAGITTGGSFTGLSGTIRFDIEKPEFAFFDVRVDAATVRTGIAARDNHLRKSAYFNVAAYPAISFVSRQVQQTAMPGVYRVTGILSMKGVTKEISFTFTASRLHEGYLFTGAFKLNRRDFGIGGNSLTLSDNLNVFLSVYGQPA